MKKKLLLTLLCSTLWTLPAIAGLEEGLTAFELNQYDAALSEFSYLADENDPIALYYLGKMYNDGLGVQTDATKAIEYFQKADALYNINATYELGNLLLNSSLDKSDPNVEAGIQYLKKAAYAGQPEALYRLGKLYEEGTLVEKEYKYAFGYYLMAALKGEKKSQRELALTYFKGRGTPQDYENGLKWLARSANQGYVLAQKDLANLRATDARLKNLPDAYAWYSIIAAYNTDSIGDEARERRNEISQKLKTDQIVLKQRQVRDWRPKSAEESVDKKDLLSTPMPIIPGFNDPETIQSLLASGEILLADGTRFDISQSMIDKAAITKKFDHIEKAIEAAVQKGEIQAYAFYGDLMQSRFQNQKEAIVWYQKGANAGDSYAQYQLGRSYCEGKGVDPDSAQCFAWLSIAGEKAKSDLKLTIQNALKTVQEASSPEDLKRAEVLIQQYKNKLNPRKESEDSSGFNFF